MAINFMQKNSQHVPEACYRSQEWTKCHLLYTQDQSVYMYVTKDTIETSEQVPTANI